MLDRYLKSGPLLERQFFRQKLGEMSFLGKIIDIERRDFKKKVSKKVGSFSKFGGFFMASDKAWTTLSSGHEGKN